MSQQPALIPYWPRLASAIGWLRTSAEIREEVWLEESEYHPDDGTSE